MKELESQNCNLNIKADLSDEVWDKVMSIFEKMEGWVGFDEQEGAPYWFSFDESKKYISTSSEPSGLLFFGKMEQKEWNQWISEFKTTSTKILGFKVGEPELGEV